MLPESLKPYFWDVDFATLDLVAHRQFIARRLMEKTTTETFRWLLDHFDRAELYQIATSTRSMPARDRTFWKIYLAPK